MDQILEYVNWVLQILLLYIQVANVRSSEWDAAVNLEEKVVSFKDGLSVLENGACISKHDPLLEGLVNAAVLSELEGSTSLHIFIYCCLEMPWM